MTHALPTAIMRPVVPIHGTDRTFPVRRIYCVGKNYKGHAAEMGEPDAAPVFFGKPADAVFVPQPGADAVRYPLATEELHHEAELVVALGSGGEAMSEAQAAGSVFAVAAGCDLTRRDRQREAKAKGEPWDVAKGLDQGAVLGPLGPVDRPPEGGAIRLSVNGEVRQDARLDDMVLSVPALIAALSRFFALAPGDLIYTGTPAGVGPLIVGDTVEVLVEDCVPCRFGIAPR